MKKVLILAGISALLTGAVVEAQQRKSQPQRQQAIKQEEVMQVLKSGFSSDPRFTWKIQQDEAQRICSQYPSREQMPAQAIQRVIQLSQAEIRYPQWGIYMGDWKEGKKLVDSPRGGRYASYGFSDKPTDKGGNCYACHLIEKGVPGGTMGPNLYQYGKRWG
ncbi:hypothetical protein A7M93_20530, partial [Acinetobacter baumannii]